jgi:hypothetical protein
LIFQRLPRSFLAPALFGLGHTVPSTITANDYTSTLNWNSLLQLNSVTGPQQHDFGLSATTLRADWRHPPRRMAALYLEPFDPGEVQHRFTRQWRDIYDARRAGTADADHRPLCAFNVSYTSGAAGLKVQQVTIAL